MIDVIRSILFCFGFWFGGEGIMFVCVVENDIMKKYHLIFIISLPTLD